MADGFDLHEDQSPARQLLWVGFETSRPRTLSAIPAKVIVSRDLNVYQILAEAFLPYHGVMEAKIGYMYKVIIMHVGGPTTNWPGPKGSFVVGLPKH